MHVLKIGYRQVTKMIRKFSKIQSHHRTIYAFWHFSAYLSNLSRQFYFARFVKDLKPLEAR